MPSDDDSGVRSSAGPQAAAGNAPRTRVISGARLIRDWDAPATSVDVVIEHGRIAAVVEPGAAGNRAPEVQRFDAEGLVLAPSFGDGHVHPVWAGLELRQAPVRAATSAEDVVAAVRRFAEKHPDDEWILGGSYDPSLAPGGLFDARWLDEACPDRPVALTSSDQHCLWVNSEALRRAGINAATPDPPDGEITRRTDGEPLGTLREWQAMALVKRLIPAPTPAARAVALSDALAALGAVGVGQIMDAAVGAAELEAYLDRARRGRLRMRVDLALRADPGRLDPAVLRSWADQVDAESPKDAAGDPLLRARIVKFFADGVVEAGTAAMLEPYADKPHSCGLPVWPAKDLADAVAAVQEVGFDVHIHAIGDAGIRNALEAIEASPGRSAGRRATLAHIQVPHPDDVPRIAKLGVVANFEPLWACWDDCQDDLTAPRLGEPRIGWQYPIRRLLDLGAHVSFGSDWPVSDYAPLRYASVAVTRRLDGSEALVADQAIPAPQALRAGTFGVAGQLDAHAPARLTVGGRADLVALSADPRDLVPEEWAGIAVSHRWFAGELVD